MIPEAWVALILIIVGIMAYVVGTREQKNKREKIEAYAHTNSKGVTYYLHQTEVHLRGGKPHTIYFFRKSIGDTSLQSGKKYKTAMLPTDKVVKENPRNGFLSVMPKDSK